VVAAGSFDAGPKSLETGKGRVESFNSELCVTAGHRRTRFALAGFAILLGSGSGGALFRPLGHSRLASSLLMTSQSKSQLTGELDLIERKPDVDREFDQEQLEASRIKVLASRKAGHDGSLRALKVTLGEVGADLDEREQVVEGGELLAGELVAAPRRASSRVADLEGSSGLEGAQGLPQVQLGSVGDVLALAELVELSAEGAGQPCLDETRVHA
jgi:hypothetical protein